MVTLYLNTSLWSWSAYLILALANCGIGKQMIVLLCRHHNYYILGLENPTFVTGIFFVSIFGLFSILDCLLGKEGIGSLFRNIQNKYLNFPLQYLHEARPG